MSGGIKRSIITLMLSQGLAIWAFSAEANSCANLPRSELKMIVYAQEAKIMSLSDTEFQKSDQKGEPGDLVKHRLVHIASPLVSELSIEERAIQKESSLYCSSPISVSLIVGIKNRSVKIPYSAESDICAFDNIKAHSEKHAALDDQIIENYLKLFESHFKIALSKLKERPASSPDDANGNFKKAARDIFSNSIVNLQKIRNDLHRKLDVDTEINSIQSGCNGEAIILDKKGADNL